MKIELEGTAEELSRVLVTAIEMAGTAVPKPQSEVIEVGLCRFCGKAHPRVEWAHSKRWRFACNWCLTKVFLEASSELEAIEFYNQGVRKC